MQKLVQHVHRGWQHFLWRSHTSCCGCCACLRCLLLHLLWVMLQPQQIEQGSFSSGVQYAGVRSNHST